MTTYTDAQLRSMTRHQLEELANEAFTRYEELSSVPISELDNPDRHADDTQRVLEEARRYETFASMK